MLGIFLDLETTGLDWRRHRVLEIAIKILDLNSGDCLHHFERTVHQSSAVFQAADPRSLEVNGGSLEKSAAGLEEAVVAAEILALFKEAKIHRQTAFFIGQNPSFDRPFFSQLIDTYLQEKLQWPYHWLDLASMYWSEKIKHLSQQHLSIPSSFRLSKDAIAFDMGLDPEKKPHLAINGVDHLIACYEAVVGFPVKS